MIRYTIIDWKDNIIYDLEKIDIDFEENEEQTSSISCLDKNDMLNELENIIEQEREELNEYLLEVVNKYDEYLQKTENRGMSYGELAYLQDLSREQLEEFEKELDKELE